MATVNRPAFERVATSIENGEALTFEMIGDIFGQDFWMMLVYTMMEANDAARAIQGAISKLRSGEKV